MTCTFALRQLKHLQTSATITTSTTRQKKIRQRITNTTTPLTTDSEPLMPKVRRFDIVKEELKLAWNATYDNPFPSGTFALVDRSTAKLPPAGHELAAAAANIINEELNINYKPLTHGIYDLKKEYIINTRELNRLKEAKHFVDIVHKNAQHKQCKLRTRHSKNLIAAYAALHPQISTDNIASCISLARYTLLKDLSAEANHKSTSWLSLTKICKQSHSNQTINNWVKQLAIQC